jgi:hypothetical protein
VSAREQDKQYAVEKIREAKKRNDGVNRKGNLERE